jgi:hypothetical protein
MRHRSLVSRPTPWLGYAVLRHNLIGQGFPNDVDAYPDR